MVAKSRKFEEYKIMASPAAKRHKGDDVGFDDDVGFNDGSPDVGFGDEKGTLFIHFAIIYFSICGICDTP